MNERLKELAEQAGVSFHHALGATYTYGKLSEILERFADLVRQDYLRELKALKPVGFMDSQGVLWNKTTNPHLHTALYALDEVKHD